MSDQKKSVFPDLVGRKFTADKPNQVYVGDITHLPTADGSNMYLAQESLIAILSKVGGFFLSADHMRTSLVQDALKMAKGQRGSLKDAIFYEDHGSVYTSHAFQGTCKDLGI